MKLPHEEIIGAIIGVYHNVYNGTGRAYPEHIFENAMMGDLRILDVPCHHRDEYQIRYKGKLVGVQRLDLFIAGEVVVKLKVAPILLPIHKAQAISYLKVVGKQAGLLLNFGGPEPEFERLYLEPRALRDDAGTIVRALPELTAPHLTPELADAIIGGLLEIHSALGPGFPHRIYANACYHELQHRGLEVRPQKAYQVIYRGRPVGKIKLGHLLVNGSVFIFPVAIQDINDISTNNLEDWMRVRNVPLAILANFHDTSLHPTVLRI